MWRAMRIRSIVAVSRYIKLVVMSETAGLTSAAQTEKNPAAYGQCTYQK